MDDLIIALLSGAAELLFEVFFQWIAEVLTGFVIRSVKEAAKGSKPVSPILAAVGYLSLGVVFGVVSVLLLPHPIFHPSRLHGVSLLISPLVTGLIMSLTGVVRRRKGGSSIRLESFGYGFAFAFGMALIRVLFVR